MACKINYFPLGNQLPYPECKLYDKSIAIKQPVGLGYIDMLSVV